MIGAVLLHNPFVSGTLAVVATGAAMSLLYAIPKKLWQLASHRLLTTVEISNNDHAFTWIKTYLAHVASTRYMTASSRPSAEANVSGDDHPRRILCFTPRGMCHFKFRGRRFLGWMSREKVELSLDHRETILLQCWRGDATLFRDLFEAARMFVKAEDGEAVEVWMPSAETWVMVDRKPPRARQSLVLPADVFAATVDDARAFLARRDWYRSMGLPWRRGYLLHGPPGNGKSTLAHVLASELRTGVSVANLSHFFSDAQMAACLGRVPPGHVLLLEDIDAAFEGRKPRPGVNISFAALLNALDGMIAQDGRILVMTTNHVDQLDEALIRPGRADVRVKIENATIAQATAIFCRFFPDAHGDEIAAFARWGEGRSMATIQEDLLQRVASNATTDAAQRLQEAA